MFVVPPPSSVMALLMRTAPPDHVQDPPGTAIVSPLDAELIADWTAEDEHDVAVVVAARELPESRRSAKSSRA
jgi:hypothetical protein